MAKPPGPDPGLTVTLQVTGAQPGIEREDLILSQSMDLTESTSGDYSSTINHNGPQSLTGGALPVDVAFGTFAFSSGASLSDRDGSPLPIPDVSAIMTEWQGGGMAPPARRPAFTQRSHTVPPALRGRTTRLSDPVTPAQSAEVLRHLVEEFGEIAAPVGLRRFRRDVGPWGVLTIDFAPAVGVIRRSEWVRDGGLEAVTERFYERRGGAVYLTSITTTRYGPEGEPAGHFMTSFAPRAAGRR